MHVGNQRTTDSNMHSQMYVKCSFFFLLSNLSPDGNPITGIDLKVASKFFANKFSCGSSVTGNGDEIVVQGDVKDDLFDILPEKWAEVSRERTYFRPLIGLPSLIKFSTGIVIRPLGDERTGANRCA